MIMVFGVLPAPATLAGQPSQPAALNWQEHPLQLMMLDKPGCVYCLAWDRQIGPGYAASPQGASAPLFRVDINGPFPNGLALARRPFATPTFILLRKGIEIGRIEGYPGREGFYPRLQEILREAGRAAD
jgi:hypothetical protein